MVIYDPATKTVKKEIHLPGTYPFHTEKVDQDGVFFMADRSLMVLSDHLGPGLLWVDWKERRVVSETKLGQQPFHTTYDPEGDRLLTTTNVDGMVNVIDVKTRAVVQKVSVPKAHRDRSSADSSALESARGVPGTRSSVQRPSGSLAAAHLGSHSVAIPRRRRGLRRRSERPRDPGAAPFRSTGMAFSRRLPISARAARGRAGSRGPRGDRDRDRNRSDPRGQSGLPLAAHRARLRIPPLGGTERLSEELLEVRAFDPADLPDVRADQRGIIERRAGEAVEWAKVRRRSP